MTDVILIGSTFPMGLIRRRVSIEPVAIADLKARLAGRPIASFWGHANTLAAAQALLGVNLAPATARPALTLTTAGLPNLDGVAYDECFVLSPEYRPGFRPPVGGEVAASDILGWQALRLAWREGDCTTPHPEQGASA